MMIKLNNVTMLLVSLLHLITFGIISSVLLPIILGQLSVDGLSQIVLKVSYGVILVCLAILYVQVISFGAKSNLLKYLALLVNIIVWSIGLLLLLGVLQDQFNVACSSIMGAHTACLDKWNVIISLPLMFPPLAILVAVALFVIIFFGLSGQMRKR